MVVVKKYFLRFSKNGESWRNKMNNSFDYLMSQFLLNYAEEYKGDEIEEISLYNQKRLSTEFRKILDKIAIEIIYDTFENEDLISAVISLNRVERIIVIFSLILGMSNTEMAFLLNTNMNSVYVQKCKAIRKLKNYIIENNIF